MPYIDLHYTENSLDEAQLKRLSEALIVVSLEAEGLPDNEASRRLSVVSCRPLGLVIVGGVRSDEPRFHVTINALAHALSKETKSQMVSQITEAFKTEHQSCQDRNGTNVWCVINELKAGEFGVGGGLVTIEQVRSMVGSS